MFEVISLLVAFGLFYVVFRMVGTASEVSQLVEFTRRQYPDTDETAATDAKAQGPTDRPLPKLKATRSDQPQKELELAQSD